MKKTYISILVAGLALSSISVFADNRDKDDVAIPYAPSISAVFHVNERNDEGKNVGWYRNTSSTSTLNVKLQNRGSQLVKERINSLQANLSAITANKSLTAEQKATLTARINTNISGLTALQTSIAASTNASSTKTLIDSIYSNFRIYGIVIPEVRLEKRVYDLQNHAVKLNSEFFVKVQTKINEFKAKGKDVTTWQKSLDDAKVLVSADTTKLAALLPTLTGLKPADYGTTSKMIIDNANATLKAISKDFNSLTKSLKRPENMKNASRKVVGSGINTPSPLFGTSWTWVNTVDNGTTTTAAAGGKFVISFGEDNHVKSSTDCNAMMGSYTIGTGTLSFGALASTKMFCMDSQETVYASALAKVSGYSVNGNTLTLSFTGGAMTFVKKN